MDGSVAISMKTALGILKRWFSYCMFDIFFSV